MIVPTCVEWNYDESAVAIIPRPPLIHESEDFHCRSSARTLCIFHPTYADHKRLLQVDSIKGGMAEWSKALVLGNNHQSEMARVRIPLPSIHPFVVCLAAADCCLFCSRWDAD